MNAINKCGTELFQYSQCLETDTYRRPGMCRGAQAAYDHCAFAKMGIDKVILFWGLLFTKSTVSRYSLIFRKDNIYDFYRAKSPLQFECILSVGKMKQ